MRTMSGRWYCPNCDLPSNTPDGVKMGLVTLKARSREDAEHGIRVEAEKRHRQLHQRGTQRGSRCKDENVRVFGLTVQ